MLISYFLPTNAVLLLHYRHLAAIVNQTCPPIGFVQFFKLHSLHSQSPEGPSMLFLLTTSLSQDWVIYAPAAFLRNGGHFSGPLSGIEPQFPVTRDRHGSPIHYHRELIGQKLIWCSAFYCASISYYDSSNMVDPYWFKTNKYSLAAFLHVLALVSHGYPCNEITK